MQIIKTLIAFVFYLGLKSKKHKFRVAKHYTIKNVTIFSCQPFFQTFDPFKLVFSDAHRTFFFHASQRCHVKRQALSISFSSQDVQILLTHRGFRHNNFIVGSPFCLVTLQNEPEEVEADAVCASFSCCSIGNLVYATFAWEDGWL